MGSGPFVVVDHGDEAQIGVFEGFGHERISGRRNAALADAEDCDVEAERGFRLQPFAEGGALAADGIVVGHDDPHRRLEGEAVERPQAALEPLRAPECRDADRDRRAGHRRAPATIAGRARGSLPRR